MNPVARSNDRSRLNPLLPILVGILFASAACQKAGGKIQSFQAFVDSESCATGETLHYTATASVEGGASLEIKAPTIPPALEQTGRSIQQGTEYIQGKRLRTIQLDLTLECREAGDVGLPPFVLLLDGQETPSNSFTVHIEAKGRDGRAQPPRTPGSPRRLPKELLNGPSVKI